VRPSHHPDAKARIVESPARRQEWRGDRALRTSAPSLSLSSQSGQTRGSVTPRGVNTRAYAFVTNEPQFWHSGISLTRLSENQQYQ